MYEEEIPLLNPANPLDYLVAEFKHKVQADELPTLREQLDMLRAVRLGAPEAGKQLIEAHLGLIATVAYQFKSPDHSNMELFRYGRQAFMCAAPEYRRGDEDFNDFAVEAIRQALGSRINAPTPKLFTEGAGRPMERILGFADKVRIQGKAASKKRSRPPLPPEAIKTFDNLSQREKDIAIYIHLPNAEIGRRTSLSPTGAGSHVSNVMHALGFSDNRLGAAISLWEQGVLADVKELSETERAALTPKQYELLLCVGLPLEAIAQEIGKTKSTVQKELSPLKSESRHGQNTSLFSWPCKNAVGSRQAQHHHLRRLRLPNPPRNSKTQPKMITLMLA